ncbi:hypothetical protein HPB50_004222 [Hyalomma asiaticum]|uniref:Uncharacterized protein n=1 Tax=Hyalomma asiaticum TaxID=266040 RepID=A0ACB7T608_HYAAI|nr:hypothetical protein HPB50_004222 [Hyalomma asiaticum]
MSEGARNLSDVLYCTTSVGRVAIALPPDGVCDYMFFDSLYAYNNFKFTDKTPTGELQTYLTAAKSSQKTVHGVGINVRYVQDVSSHLKAHLADSKMFMAALLDHKIVGFGVLSINKNQFSEPVVRGVVQAFVDVQAFVLKEFGRNDLFTVMGVYVSGSDTEDVMTKVFSSLSPPDVVIGLGHIAYPTCNMTDCEMIPHSTFQNGTKANQLRAKYGTPYSMYVKIIEMANMMKKSFSGIPWAIAATLSARVYKPTDEYDIYKRCDRTGGDEQYDSPVKYCAGKLFSNNTKFGIAAYDVNYDSGESSVELCNATVTKVGKFARVDVMRRLRDAFRDPNLKFAKHRACIDAILKVGETGQPSSPSG